MKKKRLEIKLFTLKEKRDRDQLWKSSDQIRTQLKKTVSFSNLILNSEGILFFTETLIKKTFSGGEIDEESNQTKRNI